MQILGIQLPPFGITPWSWRRQEDSLIFRPRLSSVWNSPSQPGLISTACANYKHPAIKQPFCKFTMATIPRRLKTRRPKRREWKRKRLCTGSQHCVVHNHRPKLASLTPTSLEIVLPRSSLQFCHLVHQHYNVAQMSTARGEVCACVCVK